MKTDSELNSSNNDNKLASRVGKYLNNELFNVPIGDGGNPSPSGEGKVVVMWSRAEIQTRSAHEA